MQLKNVSSFIVKQNGETREFRYLHLLNQCYVIERRQNGQTKIIFKYGFGKDDFVRILNAYRKAAQGNSDYKLQMRVQPELRNQLLIEEQLDHIKQGGRLIL